MNIQQSMNVLGGKGAKLPADNPKVNYMDPDQAPFKCGNCKYFIESKKPCAKVSDPVESNGCCNLFEKSTKE